MKRFFKIIFSAFIIGLIPFSMVNGQEKEGEKKIKKITIMGSDSSIREEKGEAGKIYIYSDSKTPEEKSGKYHKVITWSNKDDGGSGEKVTIISKGQVGEKEAGETFAFNIKSDESFNKESDSERTKYVIAKDGMMISVEGDDYDKVKEIVKDIENRLDVRNNEKEKEKEAIKKK